jgi:serine/threonine-protein kinase
MSKILLVEDNQLNRDMLSRRLERKGYEVVNAADGQEAVSKARTAAPDLILMDLSLPVLDGWAATRQLKADPTTRPIPVIALTAHAMVGDREKAIAAGCDDYEMKPVDLPRLLGKIQALLTRTSPAPGEQGFSLLVVDDNEMNREMLSRRLERQGYRVTPARSGREALDWLRKQPFDLVLLDVMMPEMNGLEVLGIIRASHSIINLPVIMVTAKDQIEDLVTALQMGANDYVTKPLNFPVVLARIQTQLVIRQTHLAARSGKPAEPTPATRITPVLQKDRPANRGPGSPAPADSRPGRIPPEAWRSVSAVREPGRATFANGLGPGSRPGNWRGDPPTTKGREPAAAPEGDARDAEGSDGGSLRALVEPQRATLVETPTVPDGMHLPGYEILAELGRGRTGVVYKARHERMNRLVAIKVIDKQHLATANAIDRFHREIQAAAQLSHPNIVLTFNAGQFGDTYFFAMEYVEGTGLHQLVQANGPLPIDEACNFIRQAARGLHHAFEHGLTHRDIKPSNLLVTWRPVPRLPSAQGAGGPAAATPSSPTRATIKILDMGLTLLGQPREVSEALAGLTRDGPLTDTADFMAPEQWMDADKADTRADLYSLGCTFYYLLTGGVPFPGDEPMEKMLKHHLDEPEPLERLRPEVPATVVAVVQRLMAKKPEDRYQQPCEVAEALK